MLGLPHPCLGLATLIERHVDAAADAGTFLLADGTRQIAAMLIARFEPDVGQQLSPDLVDSMPGRLFAILG